MTRQGVGELSEALEDRGHVLTSFERLGLASHFGPAVLDLMRTVNANPQLQAEREGTRAGMAMCKDRASKEAGVRLVRPVVELLFAGNEEAVASWDPYTVNHYRTGDHFSPHQDYLDGTVLIVTAAGVRELDVYKKEQEDDSFLTVDTTHTLDVGSILLLDGYRDLGHAARCIQGPSVSVVGDVSARVTAA